MHILGAVGTYLLITKHQIDICVLFENIKKILNKCAPGISVIVVESGLCYLGSNPSQDSMHLTES